MKNQKQTRAVRARKYSLDDKDREILKLVYDHRFLDTELLWYLAGDLETVEQEYAQGADGKHRPKRYGFGKKALYRRLHRLSGARYLEPHKIPSGANRSGSVGMRNAYGIGAASAEVVAGLAGTTVQDVREIIEANTVKAPFIQHALETARIRVLLELACAKSNGRVRLLFWIQGLSLQDWVTGENEQGEDEEFSVYPDAFFGIEVNGEKRTHYCLELDRGTMPIVAKGNRSDIRKKVFGYYHYRKQNRHGRRYRYDLLPDGTRGNLRVITDEQERQVKAEDFQPIKSFRALFVLPKAAQKGDYIRGRISNIISTFPSFGKDIATSTLFWFVTEDAFSLDDPETVFGRVWLTANPQQELQSIVE